MTTSLRGVAALGFAAILLAGADRPVAAQNGEIGEVPIVFACYVPNSGTLYVIKTADTKDECSSPKHVQVTLATPPPTTITKLDVKVEFEIVNGIGGAAGGLASCPSDRFALGGGAMSETPGTVLHYSRPHFPTGFIPTGWQAGVIVPSGSGDVEMVVYVVCGKIVVTTPNA
jgi:hypothetical protein